MKKVYLASALFFVANTLVAQNPELANSKKAEYAKTLERQTNQHHATGQDRAAGDVIWSNDFSVASDWTATGPSTDYEANGWSIGSTTNGWYFGITANMGTTGDFARVTNGDPNVPGDVVENGPFTLEYNGVIDLSGIPAPHLEFDHYGARFMTVQAVEISTNGGNDWIQVASNDDLVATTDVVTNIYGQPDLRRLNITAAIAGNPSNVQIRLFWDGAMNGPSMNYIEYGWFIDNIRIVEGFSYDSKLISKYHRSGVGGNVAQNGLDYGMVALSQATAIEFSGTIENNGGNVQTGSNLGVEVMQNNTSVFTDASLNTDIALGAIDTFAVINSFTPTTTGSYEIIYTANQQNPDGNPADNTASTTFEVTDHYYGRDNNIVGGGFTNFSSNNDDQVIIGNDMEIFANGVVGAIDVVVTTSPENVGQTIFGRIYKFDPNQNEFNEVAITAEYEITADDLGIDNPIRLYLDEMPLNITAGDELLVAVGHYGGDPGVAFATGQPVEEGTVLGFNAAGTLTALIEPEAIMVRLDLRDFTTVDETEVETVSLSQNVPNPINDKGYITYTLTETAQVSLEIVDVSGKQIAVYNEGVHTAGQYQIDIDAASLSNGVYFYTLRAGDAIITKRMIVSKSL